MIRPVKLLILMLSVVGLLISQPNQPFQNGMVVSANILASEIGVAIMQEGGNAFDAAVATGFALAVVYPRAGNIGGGGFLVAHLANGKALTLDFRETAPLLAREKMYQDSCGAVIKDLSLYTHRAVAVPGTVDGLLCAFHDYGSGKVSLQKILTPAINLAQAGFPISDQLAESLNKKKSFFEKDKGTAAIFVRQDGQPWSAGQVLIQDDLATTLSRIAKNGRAGFYSGKTADLIQAEMQFNNGVLSDFDLKHYSSIYREPLCGTYKAYEIMTMGLPSSGGIILIEMLNMLETFAIDTMEWNGRAYVHLLTEVARRSYADRAEHLGDPDFWDVPINMLIDKDYARSRASSIDLYKASRSEDIYAGQVQYESGETTHYSVIDNEGNCVAVTTTLNTGFGSGIVVDGAGFLLNNEMDDFSIKPGEPNYYGLIGNKANAIRPGKRPLSSMTPTIIFDNNTPFLIIGTPGGATIINTVLQVFLNVALHGMNISAAVAAPRVHSQWLPDTIMKEPKSISASVESQLRNLGHAIIIHPWITFGSANGILIRPAGYYGGADPRSANAVAGY